MEKEIEIKAGDQVKLKSGGPTMTVKNIGNYSYEKNVAMCAWFDGSKLKEDTFVLATLVVTASVG